MCVCVCVYVLVCVRCVTLSRYVQRCVHTKCVPAHTEVCASYSSVVYKLCVAYSKFEAIQGYVVDRNSQEY